MLEEITGNPLLLVSRIHLAMVLLWVGGKGPVQKIFGDLGSSFLLFFLSY